MKKRTIQAFIAAACCATAVQATTITTNFYADFDSATAQDLLLLDQASQNAALNAGTAVGSWSVINNPARTFAIKENGTTGNKALVYGEGTNSHSSNTWTVAQGLFASAAPLSNSSATTVSFDWLRSDNGTGYAGIQFANYELYDSANQLVFGLRWGSDANDIQYSTAAGTYIVASGVTLSAASKSTNTYSVAYPLMKKIVIVLTNGNAVVTAGTNAAFTVALNPSLTNVSSFYLKDSNNKETGDPGAWLDNLLISTEEGIVWPYTNGVTAVNFAPELLTNAVLVDWNALTESNDTLRVFAFNDAVPLLNGPAEYGAKIYGGMRVSATAAITGATFNISYQFDRLQTSWSTTTSNTVTGTGLFLWNKADFINGSGSQLSFGGTPDSSLSMTFARLYGAANYVLLDSGTYYVSDVAVTSARVLSGADAVQWATWDPASLTNAPTSAFETRTFTNVQAVGFYCMTTKTNGDAQMWLTGFSAKLVPGTTGDPVSYELTGSVTGGHGTVSPVSTNVVSGSNADFVVTADLYYRIATLTTNGTAVTGLSFDNNSTTTNFTWSNVQSAGAVVATFTAQIATDPAGTPYEWLAGYGLTNYDTDAVADQDLDGLNAWQEYIAGTDPTNTAACLRAVESPRNVISWSAVGGKVYSVYWSTNLVSGFTHLATGVQPPYTNAAPSTRANFYQVRVQLP